MIRTGLVTLWLLVLVAAVGSLFWYQDWVYQLPTPVPDTYTPVRTGTVINVTPSVNSQPGKPIFLHFFNPACPCSRFNQPQFKALVRQFGRQVNFAVVVMSTRSYSAEQIQQKLGLRVPVLTDSSLAQACGVYATPQAVLLDTHHRLYYRGNYNRSRYCTDEQTSYAKQALTALLTKSGPVTDERALTAYGCSLPYCKIDND